MATYSAIANSEIDADSPITAALMSKIRDNPIASHKYVIRASQSAANSTTTLADDGTLEFAVDAAASYAFKFVTYAQETGGAGVKIAIDFPNDATPHSVLHQGLSQADTATWTSIGTPQAIVIASYFTTADDDPINLRNNAAEYYSIMSEGFVTTVSSGTVKLRYACYNTATNAYIEAGSFLTYHRVDSV